jgi:hypothetical protein
MVHIPGRISFGGRRSAFLLVLAQIDLFSWSSSVFNCPVVGLDSEPFRAFDHHLRNLCVLRISWVWTFQKHSKGEKGCFDGLDGRPVGAEGVETDGALETGRSITAYLPAL